MSEIEYKDIKPDKTYFVKLLCADCDLVLNTSQRMKGDELQDSWANLVMSAGFNSGKCENGCRSTFSDLNINHKFEINEVSKKLTKTKKKSIK